MRRPSPRPSYDKPTLIKYRDATLHLWGDETAGLVEDRIFVSSALIHELELSLPPGGRFQHSDENRTVFAADEFYYVLEGVLTLANPETGEVKLVRPGEGVFFRRDTWHHGFNYSGTSRLRVLELIAPPPSQGTSSAYAQTKTNLTEWSYHDNGHLTQWPMNEQEIRSKWQFSVMRDDDALWRMEDAEGNLLVAVYVSTEHITVGKGILLQGRSGPVESHDGDECLYVLDGRLNVFLPDGGPGESWYELEPGDCFYLPRGTSHQYHNASAQEAAFLFGVAPSYLPPPPTTERPLEPERRDG